MSREEEQSAESCLWRWGMSGRRPSDHVSLSCHARQGSDGYAGAGALDRKNGCSEFGKESGSNATGSTECAGCKCAGCNATPEATMMRRRRRGDDDDGVGTMEALFRTQETGSTECTGSEAVTMRPGTRSVLDRFLVATMMNHDG